MRTFILSGIVVVLMSFPAWAGSYTITTTTDQEAALTWLVGKLNVIRAKQDPPLAPLSNQDYLTVVANGFLNGWVKDKMKADLCGTLTADQRAALNLTCP